MDGCYLKQLLVTGAENTKRNNLLRSMAKNRTKLQKCFDEYNEKYFKDRLYDVEVSWANKARLDGERVDGYCRTNSDLYKSHKIVICKSLSRSKWKWKLVLLHEMNHLDLELRGVEGHEEHDHQFNAGMLRLAMAGALNGVW